MATKQKKSSKQAAPKTPKVKKSATQDLEDDLKEKDIPLRYPREPREIHVREKDVDGAVPTCSYNCVLARALHGERTTDIIKVNIYNFFAYITLRENGETTCYKYTVGAKAKRAIQDFDQGKEFPTGTYRFNPVPKSELPGARRKRDGRRLTRPSGKGDGTGAPRPRTWMRQYNAVRPPAACGTAHTCPPLSP